jgi:hypothetical protein
MKKILVVVFLMMIATGLMAQRSHIISSSGYHYRPHVVVGLGAYAPFYPYYGFGYSPFFPYAPYGYGYGYRPSKLTLKVEDIKADYRDKIHSARSDKSLTHAEKREKVHELKQERDREINDLKTNYYKH